MNQISKQPLQKGLFLHPLLLVILSAFGMLFSLLTAGLFALGGAAALFEASLDDALLSMFSMAWTALFVGALFLFPLVQAIQQLTGKETRYAAKYHLRTAIILMALWVPLLLLGQWIADQEVLPWLLLPPLGVCLIAIPIFFVIELSRRKLNHPEGGGWGVYSLGVLFTQPFIIVVELVAMLILGGLALAWVSTQPELLNELMNLAERVMVMQTNPEAVQEMLLPYLQRPGVVIATLLVGAGLIPLIEELFKTLALWVMVGRKPEESAGFVLGLYAGGTFALLESLTMAASAAGPDWSMVIAARLGTGILHTATGGMIGWGLASAWGKRKYLRLALLFLASVALHGVWNALGLSMGLQVFMPDGINLLPQPVSTALLITLAVIMLGILILVNRHLRAQQTADG